MISVIRLITWKDAAAAEVAAATDAMRRASDAPEVMHSCLAPSLPGGWNSGDLLWRLSFPEAAAISAWSTGSAWGRAEVALAAACSRLDWVRMESGEGGARKPELRGGVYRALFLALEPCATPEQVAQWSRDLLGMPRHIPEILNWRLSPTAASGGTRPWTHVWEQEFARVENIKREYIEHPYHWGYVDRWFDPEMPARIIATELCHTFTAIDHSLLAVS